MTDEPRGIQAIEVFKSQENPGEPGETTLSTGVRAKLSPVAAGMLEDVMGRVRDPEPPVVYIEEKDREEPNPNDPDYLRAVADAERQRNQHMIDMLLIAGIDLLDGLPEDDGWIKKLKMLSLRGALDLSEYDLEDTVTLEYLYKRYIAVSVPDLTRVSRLSGLSPEAIENAERTFRG